ncbi:MAG: hypothetical protein ACLQDQ_16580 [Myxococcaceae bacterium]
MRRLAALLSLLAGASALASERTLTWTYDSNVLPPGSKELELWSTGRFGRPEGYSAFDNRAELEMGLVDQLQTSVYLNFGTVYDGPSGITVQNWSISNEWKWKLLDPVADVLGLALYGEVTVGVSEEELEAKLILDKRYGRLLLALNLIGEAEWENTFSGWLAEQQLEASGGAEYNLGAGFHLGLEARVNAVWERGTGFVGGAVFLGPVVSYVQKTWWVALSVMPQVVGFGSGTVGGLELDEHERLNVRLLAGFDL